MLDKDLILRIIKLWEEYVKEKNYIHLQEAPFSSFIEWLKDKIQNESNLIE